MRFAHEALTKQGFDVFWDLQVPAGKQWDEWIKSRLDQSRCAVVFWTNNSANSDNVKHEVVLARAQGKLLQVMFEPVADRALPMGTISDQATKLINWRGQTDDAEWIKLVSAIEDKATPPWVHHKIAALDLQLKAERKRVSEADGRVRALETAHEQEVATQGALRRERDKLAEERDKWVREYLAIDKMLKAQPAAASTVGTAKPATPATVAALPQPAIPKPAAKPQQAPSTTISAAPAARDLHLDVYAFGIATLCAMLSYAPDALSTFLLRTNIISSPLYLTGPFWIYMAGLSILFWIASLLLSDDGDFFDGGLKHIIVPMAFMLLVQYIFPPSAWHLVAFALPILVILIHVFVAAICFLDTKNAR